MKKTLGMLGLCGVLAAVQPLEGEAGDSGWAVIGGYGDNGVVVGNSCGNHYRQGRKSLVIKSQRAGRRTSGHYIYEKHRVWNPGYYSYAYAPCGRKVKTWHEGFHTYEMVKVWVPRRGHRERAYYR
jgi:hypothetical protein